MSEKVSSEKKAAESPPVKEEGTCFRELNDVYPVSWSDSLRPFVKYVMMYSSLFVWTYVGPLVGIHPLYAIPVLSILMTIKERNKIQRRVRHAVKNFMCSTEEKYLAKIENLPSWVSTIPQDFQSPRP